MFFIKLLCPISFLSTDPGYVTKELESKMLGKYGITRDLIDRGIYTWKDVEHIMTENYFIEQGLIQNMDNSSNSERF